MARITTALVVGYLAWWDRGHWWDRRPSSGTGSARGRGDRGDVPGWVMVTVMTAALVVAIATIATPALQNMFTTAINKVTGIGGSGGGG
ncbi:hypothetical protein [Pseudofrankia inefficax]|uniref:Uncharacterized protein n=1 Tax=Pseudofrankia inefficax (strain DSM 45817 / CECT 9037 / DDB 130130 / EuI1c) TaxID=298654 RepID=E3J0U7_PSEI1|nr:hypothetical protein [Pseudofrankia inefficax]ADP84011.1 hypothetical protein FraEuI1c_6027 [Pseudofrankia inefficax]